MKWEITRKEKPNVGDVRFITKFAWLPTQVLSKITMTDHMIWLQLYVEEQEWVGAGYVTEAHWHTVGKTIHI